MQLTKDLIPIVYHDLGFILDNNHTTFSKYTLSELRQLSELGKIKHLSRKTQTKEAEISSSELMELKIDETESWELPTLADMFEKLSEDINFNLEIKFATPHDDGTIESDLWKFFDKNVYIDRILEVVNKYSVDFLKCRISLAKI